MAKQTKEPKGPKGPRSPEPADVKLGQRVRLLRVEKGMSQTDLATSLGVSFQQVQKYEKGVNRVGASRLEQIAKSLDVPVTVFYGDGAKDKGHAEMQSLLFTDSKFALRLLRAYTAVGDPVIQRRFVTLLESVAGVAEED